MNSFRRFAIAVFAVLLTISLGTPHAAAGVLAKWPAHTVVARHQATGQTHWYHTKGGHLWLKTTIRCYLDDRNRRANGVNITLYHGSKRLSIRAQSCGTTAHRKWGTVTGGKTSLYIQNHNKQGITHIVISGTIENLDA